MLATIKKLMKSWIAAGILGLLVICMAFLGLGTDPFGALSGNVGTWVVKAGSHTVDAKEYAAIFDQMRKMAEQRNQRPISVDEAVKGGLEKAALEELMNAESVNAMLAKLDLRAPDSLVDEAMKQHLSQYPGMFDDITGDLRMDQLNELLTQNNLDYPRYRKALHDSIIEAQFFGSMGNGFKAPRIYSALQGAFATEQRDFDYFLVTPASVGAIPAPTDAEMEAFLKQNAARLMRPEGRVIKLVRFNAADFEGKVTADPAEIQKRFDFRKESLSAPELRSYVQIPIKNAGQAADVAARLTKGEDPQVIAKAVGTTAVFNTDKPKSAIFAKDVADAAFRLSSGGVSGALQGELGQSVIKVTKITPARVANLEENRKQLEADVIKATAANKAYEQAQAFDKAHGQGATLEQAAQKVGATVLTFGPLTADGRPLDRNAPVDPKVVTKQVLETAFGLPAGSDSPLIEVTAGDQFFVRVERIVPPAPPALNEVRAELSEALITRKRDELIAARAKSLSERIRKGESVEAVAASSGYRAVKVASLTRQGLQEYAGLGRDMVGTIVNGSRGQVFTVPVPNKEGKLEGLAVGKITAIRPAAVDQVAQATEMGRDTFGRGILQDIDSTTRGWARDQVKPKSDRDRAIRALGLDPKDYAEAKDDAKAPAKDEKSK